MRPNVVFRCLALLLLLAPAGARAEAAPRDALAGFDGFVERAVADWNVPGAAMAVVADGEVVFARGFGSRDLERGLPVTPDTLFAIGSTTKAFTATVLGTLVDEGELAWDAPLRTYLPGFRLADPFATVLVTPRDLLTHRTGLPRHDIVWYNRHDGSRRELVERLAHLEPSAALREKFQYNNLAYLAAGHLVEVLTGSSWEEAVRDRLLGPLGMDRTTFSTTASARDPDHALPYRETDARELERIPFRNIDLMGPAGSINSSAREMSRWLVFNLEGGRVPEDGDDGGGGNGGRRLIQPSTLREIQSPQVMMNAPSERPDVSSPAYGLGWGIDTYRGHRRLRHTGGIDGFVTSVMLFPDDGVGMVAFTNRAAGLPSILNQHAADRLLGLEPVDWNGEALAEREQNRAVMDEAESKKAATRRAGTRPARELAEYAGLYEHPGYGELRIELEGEGESAALEMRLNGITIPLEHWHYEVWNGVPADGGDRTFENLKLLFRGDVNGEVAELAAPLEPSVEPIVFRKKADPRLSDPVYLEGLAGVYELPSQRIEVELSGTVLTLHLPGQPAFTLEPGLGGRFRLAEVTTISIGFEVGDDGRATSIIVYQPSAVFEAARVE